MHIESDHFYVFNKNKDILLYEFFSIHINQWYEMSNKNKRKIKEIFKKERNE